ncbi:hypothetical protein M5K25_004935 [Dendrobium thyrsiflorum]|uniref:CCHC-type domain-containing protein n=1 Tax=Dendrobium thyrsiflorum TaxID=117978 RepID=A0ABD0VNA9_DENTH
MYWDPSNIARMAAMVGELLWMDEQSSSWGQSSYARVCVRIDLTQKLSSGFWIKGLNGRFFQRVEYEGLSHLCFHCGFIGHKVESCPLKTKLQPDSNIDYTLPSTDTEVHNIAIPISTQQPSSDLDQLGTWNIVSRRRKPMQKAQFLASPSTGHGHKKDVPFQHPVSQSLLSSMLRILSRGITPTKA